MRKIFLLIVLMCISNLITAQSSDRKWNLGLYGGATQYNGDMGQGFYKTNQPFYGFGAISVGYYLGKYADLQLIGTTGEAGFIEDQVNRFRIKMTTGSLHLRFHFTKPEAAIRPFLFAGAGIIVWDRNIWAQNGDVINRYDYALPSFGGGLNFRLSESFNLVVQETFMLSSEDDVDRQVNQNNDGFLFHTIGLTFNLGKNKDSDDDGVADKKDNCPNTPKGIKVDASGCPVDSDNDGVADYMDDCPTAAGSQQLKGCPDRDGDGISDKDDLCPDAKGLANLNGCPDEDGDGVADNNDKCPETKKGYKVYANGCPFDNDSDGLVNEEDMCPDVPGVVALKGCPDSDGDGVADYEDRCPTIKGTIANKGCPEIAKEDVKKITQIASSIYFESNSDKLKPASLIQLDALVGILKKYDAANLSIEGHTDNKGDDAYNLNLSQKRCDAVKNYLMSKGIFESRLTATGFGETKPITGNDTPEGRAKNRRVELKTSY